MLLAIDVGNTDTKFGLSDGKTWTVWRRSTDDMVDVERWLDAMFAGAKLSLDVDRAGCASVVPRVDNLVAGAVRNLFKQDLFFLRPEVDLGIKVRYNPPETLGADRLANCLGAVKQFSAPIIIVDFGSATTFDVVRDHTFIGGAIMPGVKLQLAQLARSTAKLQVVKLLMPKEAIGTSTEEAIQSGIVLGHIGAVEGIIARMQAECANCATVVATGGLSHLFMGATESISHFVPNLTLDGIAAALA